MNAIDVKNLVDFEMIMNIINLRFANPNVDVETEFEFNGKTYTIKCSFGKVNIIREDECELDIRYRFGKCDNKNPKILNYYGDISLHFHDYLEEAPTVHLWSEGFLVDNKSIDDIKKNFDVTLSNHWGDIYYSLNEFDGSNMPVTIGGALIFDNDVTSYRDYVITNDGKLFYRGREVPSEEELRNQEWDKNPAVNHYVRDRLEFYEHEYVDFIDIIKFRDRILNSAMKSYLFTKEELFLFYLKLYNALVEIKGISKNTK